MCEKLWEVTYQKLPDETVIEKAMTIKAKSEEIFKGDWVENKLRKI